MTRLWPEGEVIGTTVGAQAHRNAFTPLRGVFVWRGMVHNITRVCNRWRIDTHWWARLPEAVLDAEPSPPPSGEGADQRSVGEGEDCSAGTALQEKEEERGIWREYVKVTTDTGLLCLLYQDMHDGGWFLARIYD